MEIASPFGQLTAIHIGHDNVGENQPNFARMLLDVPECLAPISRGAGLIAERAYHPAGSRARRFLVINDQDRGIRGIAGATVSSAGHEGSWRPLAAVALATTRVFRLSESGFLESRRPRLPRNSCPTGPAYNMDQLRALTRMFARGRVSTSQAILG